MGRSGCRSEGSIPPTVSSALAAAAAAAPVADGR